MDQTNGNPQSGELSYKALQDECERLRKALTVTKAANQRLQGELEMLRQRTLPRVLIVDDDANLRRLVSLYLRETCYTLEAANAREALTILNDGQDVRLILLDLMMPEVDGFSLCRQIRGLYDLPIIMLTASGNLEHVQKALQLGANDYLVKPVSRDTLLARVENWLRYGNQGRWPWANRIPWHHDESKTTPISV
ncbi:MAG TPA: response regulator [Anaerolineae bacterium]|nr:response regulator [Anaerolineae bacterium]